MKDRVDWVARSMWMRWKNTKKENHSDKSGLPFFVVFGSIGFRSVFQKKGELGGGGDTGVVFFLYLERHFVQHYQQKIYL